MSDEKKPAFEPKLNIPFSYKPKYPTPKTGTSTNKKTGNKFTWYMFSGDINGEDGIFFGDSLLAEYEFKTDTTYQVTKNEDGTWEVSVGTIKTPQFTQPTPKAANTQPAPQNAAEPIVVSDKTPANVSLFQTCLYQATQILCKEMEIEQQTGALVETPKANKVYNYAMELYLLITTGVPF